MTAADIPRPAAGLYLHVFIHISSDPYSWVLYEWTNPIRNRIQPDERGIFKNLGVTFRLANNYDNYVPFPRIRELLFYERQPQKLEPAELAVGT